jgi:hypothetical protein
VQYINLKVTSFYDYIIYFSNLTVDCIPYSVVSIVFGQPRKQNGNISVANKNEEIKFIAQDVFLE